jgi:hypothetical protein
MLCALSGKQFASIKGRLATTQLKEINIARGIRLDSEARRRQEALAAKIMRKEMADEELDAFKVGGWWEAAMQWLGPGQIRS